jgi:hypothetical protein
MTETDEQERERCMSMSREWGDFVCGEDGYYVYWPSDARSRGSLGPHHLRWLADELDKMNADWDRQVQEWFA